MTRLRDLIQQDGRAVPEIAAAASLSPSYLYDLLSGAQLRPSLDSAGQVVAALGRKMADLD